MATLSDLLAEYTTLPDAAAAHLQRLVAEWQLLADLSFADYLLAVAGEDGELVYVAQCRPNTASTVFQQDEVGHRVDEPASPQGANPLVVQALSSGRIEQESIATRFGNLLIERIAIPVTFRGEVIAVLGRAGDASDTRPPSPLEAAYRAAAQALCEMVVEGTFPLDEANSLGLSTPRAGDGFIRIGADGRVQYASPNALSAVHRMGWTADLSGVSVAEVFEQLLTDPFESADAAAMIDLASGRRADALPGPDTALRMELDARRATVLVRAVPLRSRSQSQGAVVLIRDVTEVKRRDLALISKDATIREIHHRVKNNLQSVSALLRLQARRSSNAETTQALAEAVRRVSSIALVHEMLSGSVDEEVDLDAIVDRVATSLVDVTLPDGGGRRVAIRRENRLGVLPADLAMPLVMVMTEILQNSIEHGFVPGQEGAVIVVDARRDVRALTVQVIDNGSGLPDGFDLASSDRLGLQIVRTLVSNDLRGSIEIGPGPDGVGTRVELDIPLH